MLYIYTPNYKKYFNSGILKYAKTITEYNTSTLPDYHKEMEVEINTENKILTELLPNKI